MWLKSSKHPWTSQVGDSQDRNTYTCVIVRVGAGHAKTESRDNLNQLNLESSQATGNSLKFDSCHWFPLHQSISVPNLRAFAVNSAAAFSLSQSTPFQDLRVPNCWDKGGGRTSNVSNPRSRCQTFICWVCHRGSKHSFFSSPTPVLSVLVVRPESLLPCSIHQFGAWWSKFTMQKRDAIHLTSPLPILRRYPEAVGGTCEQRRAITESTNDLFQIHQVVAKWT